LIVVDTTILAYAVGLQHPLKDPSERFLEAVSRGRVHASTTVEVIQEFAHIRSRRFPRAEAVRVARAFARLLAPLLPTSEETLEEGLSIYARNADLGSFDAVLAATAVANGAQALLSADTAFTSVPGLRNVVPGTPDFDRLIA
jgi:uncharacterized protein